MEFIISKLINDSIYTLYRKNSEYVLKLDRYNSIKYISVSKVGKRLNFSEEIDKNDLQPILKMIYPKLKD